MSITSKILVAMEVTGWVLGALVAALVYAALLSGCSSSEMQELIRSPVNPTTQPVVDRSVRQRRPFWQPAPEIPKMESSEVSVEGGSVNTGSMVPWSNPRTGTAILLVMGAGAILGGIVVAMKWPAFRKAGIGLAVGGAALLVAAFLLPAIPVWVWILLVLAAFAGVVIWFMLATKAGQKLANGLAQMTKQFKETVSGGQQFKTDNPDQAKAFNTAMQQKQDTETQVAVKKAKLDGAGS